MAAGGSSDESFVQVTFPSSLTLDQKGLRSHPPVEWAVSKLTHTPMWNYEWKIESPEAPQLVLIRNPDLNQITVYMYTPALATIQDCLVLEVTEEPIEHPMQSHAEFWQTQLDLRRHTAVIIGGGPQITAEHDAELSRPASKIWDQIETIEFPLPIPREQCLIIAVNHGLKLSKIRPDFLVSQDHPILEELCEEGGPPVIVPAVVSSDSKTERAYYYRSGSLQEDSYWSTHQMVIPYLVCDWMDTYFNFSFKIPYDLKIADSEPRAMFNRMFQSAVSKTPTHCRPEHELEFRQWISGTGRLKNWSGGGYAIQVASAFNIQIVYAYGLLDIPGNSPNPSRPDLHHQNLQEARNCGVKLCPLYLSSLS